ISGFMWLDVTPFLLRGLGHMGIFLPSAVATLTVWAFTGRLKPTPAVPAPRMRRVSVVEEEPALLKGRGLFLPIAMFATQLAQGCFWSFLQLAGERGGVAEPVIDMVLS